MDYKPIARSSDLVVQEIGDETLVYDLKTHNAKCLNETSAAVWKLCDGKRDAVDISMSLSAQFKTSVDQELVWLAFDQLNKEDLLKSNGTEFALQGTSRRELIKKVGFAAVVALPIVSSVVAPMAAHAQSGNVCTGVNVFTCDCNLASGGSGNGTPACVAAATNAGFTTKRIGSSGACGTNDISCVASASKCPPGHIGKCCIVATDKACGTDPNLVEPCCGL